MRVQFVISMLVVFWLHILMVAYVNAESVYKGFNIQTYKHRGCVVPPDVLELPEYAHMGIPIKIWHLNNTSEVKYSNESLKFEIKNCREIIKNKQDSCDMALSFQGIAPADYDARMKCAAQFNSEIPKCRAYYDQKFRECDAIRIIPEKTAEKTSTLSKKSQWEELVPSDELPPGWEELLPSDAHLYGPEANSRKIRKDQKGGPADNWKKWENQNLQDRERGDMPSSGDSGPKLQNPNPSSYSGAKLRDPNPSDKSGGDLKDLIRLEEQEMLENEKKDYGTLGSPGGPINPGGAMNRKRTDACDRAKRRAAQTIPRITPSGSICTNYRTALRMYESTRRILSSNGCPAHEVRELLSNVVYGRLEFSGLPAGFFFVHPIDEPHVGDHVRQMTQAA